MAVDDKGPMQGPRSTEQVMKSATAVAPDGARDEDRKEPPQRSPTDDATKPVITGQEDA